MGSKGLSVETKRALEKNFAKEGVRGLKYCPHTGNFYKGVLIHRGRLPNLGPCLAKDKKGYRIVYVGGYDFKAHRLAFAMMGVEIPDDLQVDHINGVKHDNRFENLRLATPNENAVNKTRHRAGVLPCVYRVKSTGKYYSQLQHKNKTYYLGTFTTEKKAYAKYLKAKQNLIENGVEPSVACIPTRARCRNERQRQPF